MLGVLRWLGVQHNNSVQSRARHEDTLFNVEISDYKGVFARQASIHSAIICGFVQTNVLYVLWALWISHLLIHYDRLKQVFEIVLKFGSKGNGSYMCRQVCCYTNWKQSSAEGLV